MSSPTQWNFGDLFPAKGTKSPQSVSQITAKIKQKLEAELGEVIVEGELTNLRIQASGHYYFSLKDAAAQIQCVCFKSDAQRHSGLFQEGTKIIVRGSLGVYEPRGQYQIVVRSLSTSGVGALQQAFEQLKSKLKNEGLFDSYRKRTPKRMIHRIGLVTSSSGAAIQDFLQATRRRNPSLEIILAPCRVQGMGASTEIANAIQQLNDLDARKQIGLDAIVITRGGGSIEDLWAFNEEVVARAVAASTLPVISGVGHEIDTTICDLVADVRVSTPTAAAEFVTEGVFSNRTKGAELMVQMSRRVSRELSGRADETQALVKRFERCHPMQWVEQKYQLLDDLTSRQHLALKFHAKSKKERFRWRLDQFLRLHPGRRFTTMAEHYSQIVRSLNSVLKVSLSKRAIKLSNIAKQIQNLSPNSVLARGYALARAKQSGLLIRSSDDVSPGDELEIVVSSGTLDARVVNCHPNSKP